MARQGRKPEKLLRAWEVLTKKANGGLGLGDKTVYQPLELLQLNGPMSYGTAGQILTRLEGAGYLEKHTNGTTRLLYVKLLKTGPLGEDILRIKPEEPAPRTKALVETIPEPAQKHNEIADSRSNGLDGVVVLCDYENLRLTLERENATLNYKDLIARARKYGTVRYGTAFIPTNTPPEMQMRLRMARFRIQQCPPRKPLGKDTCDGSIEDFVRLLLDHQNIRTFIIVSGDGDFVDIQGEIENWHKRCVVFHYNYESTSKNLIATTGDDVVNLAEIATKIPQVEVTNPKTPATSPKIHATNGLKPKIPTIPPAVYMPNGLKTNIYGIILDKLEDGKTIAENDNIHLRFLEAIIYCLRDTKLASEDRMHKKSITELKTAIWQEISSKFDGRMSDENCRLALSALRDVSILKSIAPKRGKHLTYYVFNPNHELVTKILAANVLVPYILNDGRRQ